MKLEEGMYVRTPYGIDKIKDIVLNGNLYEDSGLYLEKGIKLVCGKEEMKNLKASHNIIDLIEVGDILILKDVKQYQQVLSIDEDKLYLTEFIYMSGLEKLKKEIEEDIIGIVTKEQFESMQYRIEK